MLAARLQCPHCFEPIAVTLMARVRRSEYAPLFESLSRELRGLESPFSSREAGRICAALVEQNPGVGCRLWEEFRMAGRVRRVRPGHRWVLLDLGESAASTPAASSTPTPAPTAIAPDGVPA